MWTRQWLTCPNVNRCSHPTHTMTTQSFPQSRHHQLRQGRRWRCETRPPRLIRTLPTEFWTSSDTTTSSSPFSWMKSQIYLCNSPGIDAGLRCTIYILYKTQQRASNCIDAYIIVRSGTRFHHCSLYHKHIQYILNKVICELSIFVFLLPHYSSLQILLKFFNI